MKTFRIIVLLLVLGINATAQENLTKQNESAQATAMRT